MIIERCAFALGHAVVQSLWQCALVGALAAAGAMCSRRAGLRYAVWCVGLLVCAAWFVRTFAVGVRVERPVELLGIAGGVLGGADAAVPVSGLSDAADVASVGFFEIVAMLWATGFAFVSVRYVMQWRAAWLLRTRGLVASRAEWTALFEEVRGVLGVSRRVCLRVSERARCPMVVGVVVPVVVVPASVLTMMSPQQVRMVLAHELAHVRRYDHVVNMVQVLIETVLFYHPVVWWMSRQARVEREHCCDDAAVRMCGDAVAYARALTELEEVRLQTRAVLGLQGGSLMKRIMRLVDGSDSGRSIGVGRALMVFAAGALIAGAGYTHAALTRETPRDDTVAAIRAGVESGELSVEQARRAYHEVVYPGSDFEKELEAELAAFRADRVAEGVSGEELEQRIDWFVGRIPFKIEERFRGRVLGMSDAESSLSVFQEELDEKVDAGELNRRDAVLSFQSQLSFQLMKLAQEMEISQRALSLQVDVGAMTQEEADRRFSEMIESHRGLIEILAAERRAGWKEEYGTLTTGSVHSPIGDMHDGIPVRLVEVDGEKKTYEFIGYPWEDGDEVVGLSGKVYEVGGRVSTTPGIPVKREQDAEPEPVELEVKEEPVQREGKLTPMDDAYWIHQGIRPLDAYDESFGGDC